MMLKIFGLVASFILLADCYLITISDDDVSLYIGQQENYLNLSLRQNGTEKLTATLGTGSYNAIQPCEGIENCIQIDDSRLHITNDIKHGFTLMWTTQNLSTVFRDCYDLRVPSTHWYGGPERKEQLWPLEKLVLDNFVNIVQEKDWGAVVEPYWLNSKGAYIYVHEKVPLFINQNSIRNDSVCFSASAINPYRGRSRVLLEYTIVARENPRSAHLHAVNNFLGRPRGHPNVKMIESPIWSTWARYKRNISDEIVLRFAQEIIDHGYFGGQLEIDDDWEECYGALKFKSPEFSNITSTVTKLKEMGFRVTLWVHPFVNLNCPEYTEIGNANNFFVKNQNGSVLTHWWNSGILQAQHIDFTNPEARDWFTGRLRRIQADHGIDSFKFDAGETTFAPQVPVLLGDIELAPNKLTKDYVEMCAGFGDLIEVRVGWKTQYLDMFVRMIDKDSEWGSKNGLYTLITTLLQMNLNGYTLVLPDMVGGNGYWNKPNSELFIRWLQANTFMPAIQLSYVPWDYLNDTQVDSVYISKLFIDLHKRFAPEIKKVMNDSINLGYPVNAPLWWIDPYNPEIMAIDTEFTLGEDIVVAPVIQEGAVTRDVYLPTGKWVDGNNGVVYEGPMLLKDYSAPIHILPYFVRQSTKAEKLLNVL